MSTTLSGNTRCGYSGLGLNPIEEVFERGFGLPDVPRGSRNEGRAAFKSRESLGRGMYMSYRKNRLSNQERFPQRQAPSMSETRSYVYKGRVPAACGTVGDGGLRTLAYRHDALGSIRAVVGHGTVQEQYHYDAFGKSFGSELETDVYTANDPVNYIDPWGLAAEDGSGRGTIYNDYVEGLQKFNSFKPTYLNEKYRCPWELFRKRLFQNN